eukprot:9452667-Lingulodinium_polyedra.AAC.1
MPEVLEVGHHGVAGLQPNSFGGGHIVLQHLGRSPGLSGMGRVGVKEGLDLPEPFDLLVASLNPSWCLLSLGPG